MSGNDPNDNSPRNHLPGQQREVPRRCAARPFHPLCSPHREQRHPTSSEPTQGDVQSTPRGCRRSLQGEAMPHAPTSPGLSLGCHGHLAEPTRSTHHVTALHHVIALRGSLGFTTLRVNTSQLEGSLTVQKAMLEESPLGSRTLGRLAAVEDTVTSLGMLVMGGLPPGELRSPVTPPQAAPTVAGGSAPGTGSLQSSARQSLQLSTGSGNDHSSSATWRQTQREPHGCGTDSLLSRVN